MHHNLKWQRQIKEIRIETTQRINKMSPKKYQLMKYLILIIIRIAAPVIGILAVLMKQYLFREIDELSLVCISLFIIIWVECLKNLLANSYDSHCNHQTYLNTSFLLCNQSIVLWITFLIAEAFQKSNEI